MFRKVLEKLGLVQKSCASAMKESSGARELREQLEMVEELSKRTTVKFEDKVKNTFVETSHFAKQPKNLSKFPHYFAKVPNFTHLDIYMVSEMFKLNSYQHHIVKKAIATGKRGSKDQVKDLQEIIATAESWIEAIEANKVL